jgi:hypothetical protein
LVGQALGISGLKNEAVALPFLQVIISGTLHASVGKTQAVIMAEDFYSPG